MVTYTALIALAENGYTITDIPAATCEYIIDRAIDYVNMRVGASIAALTGAAGTKNVTLTRDQSAVVGLLMTCMLREAKKSSLSNSTATSNSSSTANAIAAGGMSASESSSISAAISAASSLGAADDFTREQFELGIRRLAGTSFKRA